MECTMGQFRARGPQLQSERFIQYDVNYEFSNEHFFTDANHTSPMGMDIYNSHKKIPLLMGWMYAYKAMDGVLMYGVEARAHYHPHFAHRLHFETGYSNTFEESLVLFSLEKTCILCHKQDCDLMCV